MKVAIIGAGPAGIIASLTLTSKNVHVTILDEQHTIGGQIYRNLETISEKKFRVHTSTMRTQNYCLRE